MTHIESLEGQIKDWVGAGTINIFGIPYSGKDTQGDRLAEALGAPPVIGGGKLTEGDNISELAKTIRDAGGLIPSDEFAKVVYPKLSLGEFAGKPLVLSCAGRSNGEQFGLLDASEQAGHPIMVVVSLVVNRDLAFDRLRLGKRNRPEDTPEGLANRIKVFDDLTVPVLDYYRDVGMLVETNSSFGVNATYRHMLEDIVDFAEAA